MKIFYKLIFFCVLCLGVITPMQAYDGAHCDMVKHENYSTQSKVHRIHQVVTNDQGVFLLIDSSWLQSQGMQATPNGVLVLQNGEWMTLEAAIECGSFYAWQCRRCLTWNAEGRSKCFSCRTPRGEG